jgi:hypothetical protein
VHKYRQVHTAFATRPAYRQAGALSQRRDGHSILPTNPPAAITLPHTTPASQDQFAWTRAEVSLNTGPLGLAERLANGQAGNPGYGDTRCVTAEKRKRTPVGLDAGSAGNVSQLTGSEIVEKVAQLSRIAP